MCNIITLINKFSFFPVNFRHHEPHNFACATGSKTGNSDLFRLRVGKRVYGGSMQNVRGAFEKTKPKYPIHYLRHKVIFDHNILIHSFCFISNGFCKEHIYKRPVGTLLSLKQKDCISTI